MQRKTQEQNQIQKKLFKCLTVPIELLNRHLKEYSIKKEEKLLHPNRADSLTLSSEDLKKLYSTKIPSIETDHNKHNSFSKEETNFKISEDLITIYYGKKI